MSTLHNATASDPFLRAALNKCVKPVACALECEVLMASASYSLEASRLVPDGDMFLVIKCPFIQFAAKRIALADDLLMDSLGGWGVGRSYNGMRALRVAKTWRTYDRADASGEIRMHMARGFATYGNVPDAIRVMQEIVDLLPMGDADVFYRAASLLATGHSEALRDHHGHAGHAGS